VAIAATAVALVGGVARGDARPAVPRVYTVQAGDTVWGIARRIAGPQADPRPVVERIVADNGIDPAALQPGQTLELPAP
jgi:nucleoid-associated protein YgaU